MSEEERKIESHGVYRRLHLQHVFRVLMFWVAVLWGYYWLCAPGLVGSCGDGFEPEPLACRASAQLCPALEPRLTQDLRAGSLSGKAPALQAGSRRRRLWGTRRTTVRRAQAPQPTVGRAPSASRSSRGITKRNQGTKKRKARTRIEQKVERVSHSQKRGCSSRGFTLPRRAKPSLHVPAGLPEPWAGKR